MRREFSDWRPWLTRALVIAFAALAGVTIVGFTWLTDLAFATLLTAAGLLAGLSIGREGPSVQIAAGIMHNVRRWLPERPAITEHGLLIAGGAAGIAAAFNALLAGVMFALIASLVSRLLGPPLYSALAHAQRVRLPQRAPCIPASDPPRAEPARNGAGGATASSGEGRA